MSISEIGTFGVQGTRGHGAVLNSEGWLREKANITYLLRLNILILRSLQHHTVWI